MSVEEHKTMTAKRAEAKAPVYEEIVGPSFEQAQADLDHIVQKAKLLEREIADRRLAQNLAMLPEIDPRAQDLADSVADFIRAFRSSPLKFASDFEATKLELETLQPFAAKARDLFLIARGAEAASIAKDFRPRHLAATKGVMQALEALADAMEIERNVRAEYAAASPEPRSALLPDMASDLDEADISNWSSQAAQWARRVRALGVTL